MERDNPGDIGAVIIDRQVPAKINPIMGNKKMRNFFIFLS
jgi:hypothetical protein